MVTGPAVIGIEVSTELGRVRYRYSPISKEWSVKEHKVGGFTDWKIIDDPHISVKRTVDLELRAMGLSATKDLLAEQNPEALLADGFDTALVGTVRGYGMAPVALYSYDACVRLLMERDGMSEEGAREFLEFNVLGAYVGEYGPMFMELPDVL